MGTERGLKGNQVRKAALYFLKWYAGMSNKEIGRLFAGVHFSGVSKTASRIKEEMANDRSL
jgi:chromosomal replication initiation ATPase DnaA